MRTKLGWTISYKSLYFVHPSLELVPLLTGMRKRSIMYGEIEISLSQRPRTFSPLLPTNPLYPSHPTRLPFINKYVNKLNKKCCEPYSLVPWYIFSTGGGRWRSGQASQLHLFQQPNCQIRWSASMPILVIGELSFLTLKPREPHLRAALDNLQYKIPVRTLFLFSKVCGTSLCINVSLA